MILVINIKVFSKVFYLNVMEYHLPWKNIYLIPQNQSHLNDQYLLNRKPHLSNLPINQKLFGISMF